MDEDFNWSVVHVFDDTVGHSPCVTWQILFVCCGCLVWALNLFFVLLRCFLSMAMRKSGRGFACRLLVFVLLVVLCDPICRFPDETTVFHAEFLIRLFYNDFTVICKRRLGYGTSVAAEDLFFLSEPVAFRRVHGKP